MKDYFIVIETTYPKISEAKKLAKTLLIKNLASCIEFSKINSLYLWQQKIENSNEILVKIKTKNSNYNKIENVITTNHPYQLPQIISTKIDSAAKSYLDWIDSNLKK